MPIYQLEFQIEVKVPPSVVYEHLSDPHNFVGLQPLLTHVEGVIFNEEAGMKTVSYETVEAFRWLGRVLYRNRIRVQTKFTSPPYQFDTLVRSFPNITLNVRYTFTPSGQGTWIKENFQIQTHPWLKNFVLGQATKAQHALLENLKNRLESRGGSETKQK